MPAWLPLNDQAVRRGKDFSVRQERLPVGEIPFRGDQLLTAFDQRGISAGEPCLRRLPVGGDSVGICPRHREQNNGVQPLSYSAYQWSLTLAGHS
jgi:hypothetical protein